MKRDKIIYWILTGLFCLWMTFQGIMFIFNSAQFEEMFASLGFSATLIIPLGIAKVAAVIAILWRRNNLLKKLAYVGLGIDFIIAILSHLIANDGNWPGAAIALALMLASYIYDGKVFS